MRLKKRTIEMCAAALSLPDFPSRSQVGKGRRSMFGRDIRIIN